MFVGLISRLNGMEWNGMISTGLVNCSFCLSSTASFDLHPHRLQQPLSTRFETQVLTVFTKPIPSTIHTSPHRITLFPPLFLTHTLSLSLLARRDRPRIPPADPTRTQTQVSQMQATQCRYPGCLGRYRRLLPRRRV